jgi:hypothetical protein
MSVVPNSFEGEMQMKDAMKYFLTSASPKTAGQIGMLFEISGDFAGERKALSA